MRAAKVPSVLEEREDHLLGGPAQPGCSAGCSSEEGASPVEGFIELSADGRIHVDLVQHAGSCAVREVSDGPCRHLDDREAAKLGQEPLALGVEIIAPQELHRTALTVEEVKATCCEKERERLCQLGRGACPRLFETARCTSAQQRNLQQKCRDVLECARRLPKNLAEGLGYSLGLCTEALSRQEELSPCGAGQLHEAHTT
mmetsp:Transcript_70864/g.153903  ORF Transcript_70864/g.153903 Transcript_70864/m.153903 type:complete len:201 (+) Transcript_70864:1679-2281(+)